MQRRLRALARIWNASQVELQGLYSPERLIGLAQYTQKTSWIQVLMVLVATPLPCLAVTILLDVVKLADPSEGLEGNSVFIVREYVSYWIMTFLATQQFRTSVPTLPISNLRVAGNSFVVAGISVAMLYAIALGLGFPVPFTIVTGCPGWAVALSSFLAVAWAAPLRASPESRPLVVNVLKVWVCQVGLVILYPAYFYVFQTLSPTGKALFSLLLPPIKLIVRNIFARTVVHLQDEMVVVVVFNAEVYNALFSAYCFQNSPSIWTTAGLMAADFAQCYMSLRDVSVALGNLRVLTQQLRRKGGYANRTVVVEEPTALELAEKILQQGTRGLTFDREVEPCSLSLLPASLPSRSRASVFLHPTESIAPALDEKIGQSSQDTETVKARYAREVRRLLYMTEFIISINYVEVFVPLVFSIYLAVMYHLPNREYYTQFMGLSRAELLDTLKNVLAYCTLQLISLLLLTLILRAKLRFSAIHQLAFVLEKQWVVVQTKLVFWVHYNVQSSLEHFGYDYSFQFAWLQSPPELQSASSGSLYR